MSFSFSKFLVRQNNFSKVFCTKLSSGVLYLVAKKPKILTTNIIKDIKT